eukprot:Awhi_evm1s10590
MIGILLVHDVTNRKSFENLDEWLMEILGTCLNNSFGSDNSSSGTSGTKFKRDEHYDPEHDQSSVPIFVVGTKSDLYE